MPTNPRSPSDRYDALLDALGQSLAAACDSYKAARDPGDRPAEPDAAVAHLAESAPGVTEAARVVVEEDDQLIMREWVSPMLRRLWAAERFVRAQIKLLDMSDRLDGLIDARLAWEWTQGDAREWEATEADRNAARFEWEGIVLAQPPPALDTFTVIRSDGVSVTEERETLDLILGQARLAMLGSFPADHPAVVALLALQRLADGPA